MADTAISPEFLKSYRDWQNQRQATTGLAPRPEDFQALAEANLNVQASNKYRDRAQQMQQEGIDMQKGQIDDQRRAATVSGITGTVSSAAMTYGAGKALGMWGGASTPAVTGAGANAGITTAAGVTEGEMATSTAAETGAGVGAGGSAAAYTGIGAAIVAGTYGPSIAESKGMNPTLAKALFRGPEAVMGSAAGHTSGKMASRMIDPVGWFGDQIVNNTKSIICTELHRQGLISNRQRRYGAMFGRHMGEELYYGYLIAAEPVVKRMQKSSIYTRFVSILATSTLKEMSHRVQPREKGSLFGSLILRIFIPYCLNAYDGRTEETCDAAL
jgi:hypothetical protein